MKKIFLFLLYLSIYLQVHSQDLSEAKHYAQSIDKHDLQTHIKVLSSDSLAGRGMGSPGLKKAQDYIQSHFKKTGLQPMSDNYLQPFYLIKETTGETYINIKDKRYENGVDFAFLGKTVFDQEIQSQLFYVDQLQDPTIHDHEKIISVAAFPSSKYLKTLPDNNEKGSVFIISNRGEEANQNTFEYLKKASNNDLYFAAKPPEIKDETDAFLTSPRLVADAFGISVKQLMNWDKNTPNQKQLRQINNPIITIKTSKNYDTIVTANVIGFIEGSLHKNEILVISAHYDHLGTIDSTYYPGADDNGSGISALLEIAEAFKQAKENDNGPARSLLFIAFTGEEEGLFGSSYFVENPLIKLDDTMVNLNIDMIGRTDDFYNADTPYLYLIGSDKISSELHQISEEVNQKTIQLKLDYRYNADNDPNRYYYRSDHFNFARHGIPVIFYFNGTHQDYHEVTDTENKINYQLLQQRAQLIFYTAWELANREKRLKTDK
ncbi:MAG: M28 family peptidase [Cyclobacteriaceae bacterium]